jgi:hypothetical protein
MILLASRVQGGHVPISIRTQYDDYKVVWAAWAEEFHDIFEVRGQDELEARTRMQQLAECVLRSGLDPSLEIEPRELVCLAREAGLPVQALQDFHTWPKSDRGWACDR